MFENPRRGRQARNFTTNVPKILDLKSSSEQIFSKNWPWVPLVDEPYFCPIPIPERSLNSQHFIFYVSVSISIFALFWELDIDFEHVLNQYMFSCTDVSRKFLVSISYFQSDQK